MRERERERGVIIEDTMRGRKRKKEVAAVPAVVFGFFLSFFFFFLSSFIVLRGKCGERERERIIIEDTMMGRKRKKGVAAVPAVVFAFVRTMIALIITFFIFFRFLSFFSFLSFLFFLSFFFFSS